MHAWESFGDGVAPDLQAVAKGVSSPAIAGLTHSLSDSGAGLGGGYAYLLRSLLHFWNT